MGLASRKLGVPVRWIEDRIEHLAASAASTARTTTVRAGFSADGELRRARATTSVEDVGAYVRAPEPATLYRMHGSLSGAYRVRHVAARNRVVAHEPLPDRAQPRLRRPAALPRARGGDGRSRRERLGLDPAELRRRNLIARRRVPVPDAVRRPLRLGRLRGLPRPRARARRATSERREEQAARARGRAGSLGIGARLRRRAVDLEHGLHHARADGRGARAGAAEVGQRRGRDRDRLAARRHHRPGRRRRRRARATRRSAPRSSPTPSASAPRRSRS